MKILVADDPETRKLIAEFLREQGHLVDAATDGVDALDRLWTGAYDVAFLDYPMPGMSGMDVLRAARARAPRARVTTEARAPLGPRRWGSGSSWWNRPRRAGRPRGSPRPR